MNIRSAVSGDRAAMFAIWNQCQSAGEVVYKPMDDARFQAQFLRVPDYDGALDFVCEENGEVLGFISGAVKKRFLPGETHENTPGYLTCLFVRADARARGVGGALLSRLEAVFRALGKRRCAVSGNNPVNLGWLIPGTPGHDHNNAPGVDADCMGYAFLQNRGYKDAAREVAMYLNLADYRYTDAIEAIRARLLAEGVRAGAYDCAWNCEFDGMCDRVGSEYWRKVLRDETTSAHPRTILAGVTNGHMVGFTGPVDLEPSGRGWFTGICVDPLYEKRGIATVIFNDLMREFVKEGAKFSTLFTGVENHAQKLYRRTGFRAVRTFAIMTKEL